MSTESIKIVAQSRVLSTKGALREMRQNGLIPATVFGKSGTENIAIPVKNLPKHHTRSALVTIDVEGKSTTVLMRDVQVDPLKDTPIHMDFQEVSTTETVKAKVPLNFIGLTRDQEKEGSFKVLIRSLMVKGPANKLPEVLTVDVSRLKVDESAHVGDLSLPEGIKLASSRNLALASLVRF